VLTLVLAKTIEPPASLQKALSDLEIDHFVPLVPNIGFSPIHWSILSKAMKAELRWVGTTGIGKQPLRSRFCKIGELLL